MNTEKAKSDLNFAIPDPWARSSNGLCLFCVHLCSSVFPSFLPASLQPVGVGELGEDAPQAAAPARAQHRAVRVAFANALLHAHAQAVARIPQAFDRGTHRLVP